MPKKQPSSVIRPLKDLVEEHLRDNPVAERPEGVPPPDWGPMPRRHQHYSVHERSPLDDMDNHLPNGEPNWRAMGRKGAVAREYYKRHPEARKAMLRRKAKAAKARMKRPSGATWG